MRWTLLAILLLTIGVSAVCTQSPPKQPPVSGSTRVAVVNITYLLNNYSGAFGPRFKSDVPVELAAEKQEKKKYQDEIRLLEQLLKDGNLGAEREDQIKSRIATAKKLLEEVDAKVKIALGKKQEENLVRLWQEIQSAIKVYAADHDVDVVLGYADPTEKGVLDKFPNVNRKVQSMDFGGTVPLFATPSTDISHAIVQRLNKWKPAEVDEKPARVPRVGTDRVAVVNIAAVFDKFEKSQHLKKVLEEMLAPFKARAKGLNPKEKKELSAEVVKIVEKKQEAHLMETWKDLQIAIKAHAAEHNLELVLAFGDPPPETAAMFSVNRKLQAMDLGSTVPLFASSRVDISEAVIARLNQKYREKNK